MSKPIHWPSLTDAEKAALVAEECMEWESREQSPSWWYRKGYQLGYVEKSYYFPHLDHNQSAEVVEVTLASMKAGWYRCDYFSRMPKPWRVMFSTDDTDEITTAHAPTRSEAEVLACLRARGVEIET